MGYLKRYYQDETQADRRVILFRFASTDYFCGIASPTGATVNPDTYVAQETVFLDFDIIELTFNRDGVYRVIPIVSSPQDFINSITAPAKETEWWKIILMVVLLVLLLILLWPLIPILLRAVIAIIALPFRLVGALVKMLCKKNKKT